MRTIPLAVILIVNWTLVSLAEKWGIDWWKLALIYLLAAIAVIFAPFLRPSHSKTEAKKTSEVLEEIQTELTDAIHTKPVST